MNKKINNMTFKRNLLFGLGLSMILLLISSFASYFSIKNLIDSSQMVRNSNRVIKDLDHVFSLIKDAETGQRGYLLTGDQVFLMPYTRAKEEITVSLKDLSGEFTETTVQSENFEK